MDPRLKLTALEKTLSALANIDLMPPVIVSPEKRAVIATANDTARFLLNGAGIGPNTAASLQFLFRRRTLIATMHFRLFRMTIVFKQCLETKWRQAHIMA